MIRSASILTAFLAFGALASTGVARADPIQIVAFGDSNTAGFGVVEKNTYPAQLERALKAKGYNVEVTNSGVSGSTSGGGLARFDDAIPEDADVAIVFFGRNDVRFGVEDAKLRANLDSIVRRLREQEIEVILVGFTPKDFSEIAAAHDAFYYPDFFAGVATNGVKYSKYVLFWDLIGHLNAAGYQEIVSRMSPLVETAVTKVYCNRLEEAAFLAPECKALDKQPIVTGSTAKTITR
jgi:acyl-CoA thioesterase-1